MSIHPSLKTDMAGTQQRSVLSRIERIKDLMKKGLWVEDQQPTGLPKTKIVKIKSKKTKTKAEETQPVAGAAPAAAPSKPEAGKKSEAAKKPETAKEKK